MKKIISMLFIVGMCSGLLVGCGGKPKDVSQEVYDLGVETCDVLDDYIQGKMSQDTAADKIDVLGDKAKEIDESCETNAAESLILTYVRTSYSSVSSSYVDKGETYRAEDKLKELKEELNLK